MPMPSSRAFSPPTPTVSSNQGSPSPVQVKKVVIEGRSKHDGASLKMYLKLSVAVDNVSPVTTIPLFREDNIRITHSKVHPLDDRSVPYFFSGTEQLLLHKAAVALQLGTKSSKHYNTLFPSSPRLDPSHVGASRRNRESIASESSSDDRFTGHIVVSGYHVSLVLPREFPPRVLSGSAGAESDGDDGFTREVPSSWSTRSSRKSSGVFHKTYFNMMAALDMFVPYVTIPPKGPFLVSIPVPRCLDNHVKLRIATPPINLPPSSDPRGSLVSTSSEDEMPGWDFLTDPPVSRKMDQSMRKDPYQQSADDEQSDSHSGSPIPGTELIQGAYQSTEVLHVRWAPPQGKRSAVAKTEDGMRRVGIERTVGKMTYEVLGRDAQGIKLGITYDGVCSSLWHPGVATMLGMDIALDVKGRRVSWPEDGTTGWTVSGDNGFAGLYSEAAHPSGLASRRSSLESSSIPFLPTLTARSPTPQSRTSASLLRAPLPNHNTPEYSFESSPRATPPLSMPSTDPLFVHSNNDEHDAKLSNPHLPPGKSLTLKINLLKLLPPAKNIFNFIVKGTVVVDADEDDFIPLPVFRVLGSDREKIDGTISLQATNVTLQVGTESAEGPRRLLERGEEVRCENGFGLILRAKQPPVSPSPTSSSRAQSRIHSPRAKFEASERSGTLPTQSLLPCVLATVTPLPLTKPHTHCVRVNIPAYTPEADVMEFGLTIPQHVTSTGNTTVDVLYAMYAGRYVRAEALPRGSDALPPTLWASVTPEDGRIVGEVQFLIVVHLDDVEADGGDVEVVYLVGEGEEEVQGGSAKGKAREEVVMDILLPCFQQSISRYEVEIDCPTEFDPHVTTSTLSQYKTRSTAMKFTRFSLPAEFFPVLTLSLRPSPEVPTKRSAPRRVASTTWRMLPNIVAIAILYLVVSIGSEVQNVRETINATARAFIGGVPYADAYWGDGMDAAGRLWWWPQDQASTRDYARTTAPPTDVTTTSTLSSPTNPTSWEKETLSPGTPTVNLAEATAVRERRPQSHERTRDDRTRLALIPLPAVPLLSWHPLSSETKELILKGIRRVLHVLRRIIEFPLNPD